MIYPNCKIHGPYTSKTDGRKRVVIVHHDTGKKQTVSYPKYLLEIHLGRYLAKHETVDHRDRDFTNDAIDNLQILEKGKHSSIDAIRLKAQTFVCPVCDIIFTVEGRKLHNVAADRNRGKSGPYCSRSCAGIDSHNATRVTNHVVKEYYRIDKSIDFKQ